MSSRKMHNDEVDTSPDLVRRLIAAQFPQWKELDIATAATGGTDNVMYRLGETMAVRMPRIERTRRQVEQEAHWLPIFAPHLPLAVPVPLALGEPGEGYPFSWAVVPWLPGDDAAAARIDLDAAATDLAGFIDAMQRLDPTDGPRPGWENAGRGMPLRVLDEYVRTAMAAIDETVDREGLFAVWDAAVEAPPWDRAPVWIHGDLGPDNLLACDGCLSAVIDFGCMAVGDPACELIPAWGMFSGRSREVFREAVGMDDATWARARGWIVMPAVTGLSYYAQTDPSMVERSRRAIEIVLSEFYASER